MIARIVFVVFCAILQSASCQGDDDTIINLDEFIIQKINEVNDYTTNIQAAIVTFYDENYNAVDVIYSLRNETQYQLVELASSLNQNNYDVSDCLMLALKNVSNTVYETRMKLELLNEETLNRDLENSDYRTLQTELNSFLEELRLSNDDCMIFDNVNTVNSCISGLITELNDEIESIKRRIDETEPLLASIFEESTEILRKDMDEFEVSIQNTIQASEQELIDCINKL